MSKARSLGVTPGQRFATGCIAVLTRDGVSVTRHFTGEGADSTRAVADYCDREGYRVVVLSTPTTIYRDLQGTRATVRRNAADSWFYAPPPVNHVDRAEAIMLSAIGRRDLLV